MLRKGVLLYCFSGVFDVLLPEAPSAVWVWLVLGKRRGKREEEEDEGARGGWSEVFRNNVLSKRQLFPGRRGHFLSNLVMTYRYVEHWDEGHSGMVLTSITLHIQ